jgi:hypothetical protein
MGACAVVLLIRRSVSFALHTGHCSLLGVNVAVPGGSHKVGLRQGSRLCPVQLHLPSYPLHHYPARVDIHPVWGIVLSFTVYEATVETLVLRSLRLKLIDLTSQ